MLAILTLFTALGMLAMPWLVLAMASGFAGDERFDLAVTFGTIAFPYILLISLTALLSGVLNAMGRFIATSAVPVLLNLVFVLAMLAADRAGWDMGLTLAWAVPVAGVVQLAATFYAAHRGGPAPALPPPAPDARTEAPCHHRRPRPAGGGRGAGQPDRGPAGRELHRRRCRLALLCRPALPVAAGCRGHRHRRGAAARPCAAPACGGRGRRPRQFQPRHRIRAAADAARRRGAGGDRAAADRRAVPARRFDATDTANTAMALAAYGAGLPAFVLQKVLQPLYYAREDTRRPFNYAVVSMVANAVIAIGLMPVIGFLAAALATSISAWIMVWQLWAGSRGMGDAARFDDRFRTRLPRIALCSALMGLALWAGAAALAGPLGTSGLRYLALLGLIGGAIALYFGLCFALGALRPVELKAALRRQR
jgi:putative peptidoglycan lipid II flippase